MEVYMDNSATTRTFPEVAELMTKIMCEDYGNPSSLWRRENFYLLPGEQNPIIWR